MASMAISGLFNAFAFAGAGFLFSKLNHSDYEKEMHRHNLAQEKLRRDQEKFFENQTKLRAQQQELLQKQHQSDLHEKETNQSLAYLNRILDEMERDKPTIKDYYHPSEEMKHYQNLSGLLIACGLGGFIFYVL